MRKKLLILSVMIIFVISLIAYTDLIIRPGYLIKTFVKAPLFFFIPVVYGVLFKEFKPFNLLKANFRGIKLGIILGVGIYILMVGFYFAVSNFMDINTTIKASLENNLGINKENFFAIALYVCLLNSFLEEWFFRGFIFNEFKIISRKSAYFLSSLAFTVYHIAIMDGMFNVFILLLAFLGLFVGGTIFNYLNEKNNNIYASWFCHMFANFAMNTIGYIIYFIN